MGRLPVERFFPFPEQNPADRAVGDILLAKVANFLTDHVDADRIDTSGEFPAEVIDGLRQLGLFGLTIPGIFGGLGLSPSNCNRILQLVASHCATLAALLVAHQSSGIAQQLIQCGTPEQKAAYLPRLAGGAIGAFALIEAEAGTDLARLTTTATLDEDGTDWLIDGEKLWVSNGPLAELLIVLARTRTPQAEPPEITAFIVETASPGVSVPHRCEFMGLKGLPNSLVRFEQVRVPAANVVGGRGGGPALALATRNAAYLTVPAVCSGVMKQALAMATTWARECRQWGAPIGEQEVVAARLAGIAADLYAVESLTWLTSAWADRNAADFQLEAVLAGLFSNGALWRGTDATQQLRGGRGFETVRSLAGRGEMPMPMERLLRDARGSLLIEEPGEILRLFIAGELLAPHLRIAGIAGAAARPDYLDAAKYYGKWYPRLYWPNFKLDGEVQLPEALRSHLHDLERETRRLARDLFHMLLRHRQNLQHRQLVLIRLVDCAAELFAIGAVLSRAASPAAPAESIPLADLFCRQARRRLAARRRELCQNDDADNTLLARALLDGRFAWLTGNIVSTWRQDRPYP